MQRQRARLAWVPQWEGSIKAWAINFIKKHKWRCDQIHEFSDLLNDAWLTYRRIEERYPRVIEPAHFMALYQRAMWNELHDRSRYLRRKREIHAETSADVSDFYTLRIGEITNSGYLNAILAEAPEELQLALIMLAKGEVKAQRRGRQRENLNMQLRRALKLDQCRLDEHRKFDFSTALKALLT